MLGPSADPPAAQSFTALVRSRGGVVLMRNPAAPALEGTEHVIVHVERREHQTPRGRDGLGQPSDRRHPADAWHLDVHEDHVGRQPPRLGEGLVAAARLSDDSDLRIGAEHTGQPRAHHGVVVDDQYPYSSWRPHLRHEVRQHCPHGELAAVGLTDAQRPADQAHPVLEPSQSIAADGASSARSVVGHLDPRPLPVVADDDARWPPGRA